MASPQSANVGDTPSAPGPVPSGVKMPDFSKYSQDELARMSSEDRKKIWRDYFLEKKHEFQVHCRSGSINGCNSLAEWYLFIARNTKKAEKIYRRTCTESQDPTACFNLANIISKGDKDVSASAEEAVKLYELACKGKNGPACRSASFAHLNGEGTPVNVEKGLEYGAIACEQFNQEESCSRLAYIYMGFNEYAAFMKKQKAANYFRLSCELTNYRSCHNLATMYKLGDGVAKDMEMYQHYKDVYDDFYAQYYV